MVPQPMIATFIIIFLLKKFIENNTINSGRNAISLCINSVDGLYLINNKLISASEEGTCLIVTDFSGEYTIRFYAIDAGWDQTEYILGGFSYILK